MNQEKIIDVLTQEMIRFNQNDPQRIHHLIKVHRFAQMIGHMEHLDEHTQFITECAALVHDIGIRPAEKIWKMQWQIARTRRSGLCMDVQRRQAVWHRRTELGARRRRPQPQGSGDHRRADQGRCVQRTDRRRTVCLPARRQRDFLSPRHAARAWRAACMGGVRHGQAEQHTSGRRGRATAGRTEKSRHPLPHDSMGPGL